MIGRKNEFVVDHHFLCYIVNSSPLEYEIKEVYVGVILCHNTVKGKVGTFRVF